MTTTPATPSPQHAVLILPSSGAFDSRAYRIATTLVTRGHQVTIVARLQPGLEIEEVHPAGYRIVRVRVSANDGVPFARRLTRVRRRLVRLVRRRPAVAIPSAPTPSAPAGADLATGRAPARRDPSRRGPIAITRSLSSRARRSLVRRFAIPLTLRAHVRAARAVAPAADLYHGMAYMGIPPTVALGRANRAPVVYDARDIYLEARSFARKRGSVRWVLAAAERRWAQRASRVITVNDAYADEMERRLGVERPLVVMNCSYRFEPPEPRERRFHELLGLDPSAVLVLYHGGLFPERGIEQLMEAILDVPGAVLVLMGYGVLEQELRERADEARYAGRVRLVPPVPPDELLAWLACADIAAMPIQGSTMNHRLTTPNKLFEAMAAGVAVVASDLPGMARIITETGCGVLCDGADPASIAAALRDLVEDPVKRRALGSAGLDMAHDRYNWERQAEVLLREYTRLTGRPW